MLQGAPHPTEALLSALSGDPSYSIGPIFHEPTYTLNYTPGDACPVREGMHSFEGNRMQAEGNSYNRILGTQNNDFFLTQENNKDLLYSSSAGYTMAHYGKKIEDISGQSVKSLRAQIAAYSINNVIYDYFAPISDHPQEDDLVVYSNACDIDPKPIVGFFNHGMIVAKYDDQSVYVFQQKLAFFCPPFRGNVVHFYRLKGAPVSLEALYPPYSPSVDYIATAKGFDCVDSPEIRRLRERITITPSTFMSLRFPSIQTLEHIHFSGVCFDYAFGKFLNTYKVPFGVPPLDDPRILEKYFDTTNEPMPGDLVVYFNDQHKPKHYGIYLARNLIESKWGITNVYRGPYFQNPNVYGNHMEFLVLKPGLSKEALLANLRVDFQKRHFDTPIIYPRGKKRKLSQNPACSEKSLKTTANDAQPQEPPKPLLIQYRHNAPKIDTPVQAATKPARSFCVIS